MAKKKQFGFIPLETKLQTGFTLVELLVTISIISVLASVVLTAVNSARAKARDARRISDLRQMAIALELYYDTNGQYPPDAVSCDTSAGSSGDAPPACTPASDTTPGPGDFWVAGGFHMVSPAFISISPSDPRNIRPYFYLYEPVQGETQFGVVCPSGNACAYIISALLENTSNPHVNPGCNQRFPGHNYCIAGSGARLGTP
ncbi:MAG: putative General secretion pathway protein GspG [Parcubacteria group bacterium Gr01-1014_33]|nr:MAG: putative General secretion pathway protein GspG [Parcubacteria group bacterium Gr01-1014_33]